MQLVEWQNRPRLTKTHFDAFVGVGFLVCSQFYQMVFIASGMKEKSKEKNKRKKAEKESIILEGTWRKSLRGEKRSRRRILRCGREKDLEVALTAKKYEPHALGRAYAGMKFVEKLVAFSKRLTKKTAIFGIKTTYRSVIIAVAIAMVYAANPVALSAPHATTVTFKQDWDKGNLSNINTESSQDSIQLKPTGSWGARVWAPPQDVIAYGHSSAIANGYMYVFRGYSDKAFWRYNIAENKWDTLPDLPVPAYYGADMIYDGNGAIYAIFGGYSQKFYKYIISTGTWTQLPDLLDTPWQGAAIETDGTNIFVVRGNSSTDFWRFNVADNTWSNLAPVSATVGAGGDLINGQDGYFYLTRGASTLTFYRYKISGTGGNTWEARTNATSGYTFTTDQRGAYYDGNIYFFRSGSTTSFLRFNLVGNSWSVLSGTNEVAPATANYCSLVLNPDDNKLYGIRGNGTTDFWKFDPSLGTNGEWEGPKQMLDGTGTVGTGGDLIWNGQTGATNYVYAIRGGSNAFYRYDVATNIWTNKATLPNTVTSDVKATFCNGYVYALRGGNSTDFYRYSENAWTTLTTQPFPATANNGAGLACASDNSIYGIRGNGTTNFYRYTDAGGWTALSNMVVGGVTYYANVGARIVTDGTDVYVMLGDGETTFLKYSGGAWSKVTSTPFAQYYGTDMTYANGKIYALAGYYKDDTWEYTIATDTWRKLPDNQQYTFGRGPYNGASIEYAGGTSLFATTGQALADMWSYTTGATNFVASGTYVSQSFDLGNVQSWVSFNKNDNTPTNTNLVYETRSSSDNESWSSWQAVSGTTINSSTNRYLQVRATLSTTDGIYTPTVSDYTISYNSEDDAPSNPTAVDARSQQVGGQALTSGQSYPHEHPYFSWSGASDSGSGIEGYYVYFGTQSDADPFSQGSYQTASSYTVNLAMQAGTYYLRIKTKDVNGNVAAAAWDVFTYVYSGVSPYLDEQKTASDDFNAGTLTNVTSASVTDSIRLNSTSGFWNQARLSLAPGNIVAGGELTLSTCRGNSNHCLYTFGGGNGTAFHRYEIETDTWTTSPATVAAAPLAVNNGGFLVAGPPGYLYATRGVATPTFWMYDIENNVWSTIDSAPKNFDYGSNLSYDGSRYVYAMPGNDDAFYKYDTCNGQSSCTPSWTQLANAEFGNPNTVDGQRTYAGGDAIYDEHNNIYVIQGNYYPYFAKYSINDDLSRGEHANSWTSLPMAPEGIYDGGTVVFDSATNSIYMLSGKSRLKFYRYDIESAAWSLMPDAPASISYGASMVVYNGYIYVTRGSTTTGFYRFNIAENTWELPQRAFFGPSTFSGTSYFYYGSDNITATLGGTLIAGDGSDNLYMVRGAYDNTFGKYNVTSGAFTELAKLPIGSISGASFTFNEDENAIYYIPGNIRVTRSDAYNPYFFRYLINTNTWEEITTDRPPLKVAAGSSMTYDGSQYIYLTRGGGNSTWWRYDTTAAAGSRWSAALPVNANCLSGDGGKIVYRSGYIYLLRAGNNATTCRYDIDATTWALLGNLPAVANYGANMIDGKDGYLYASRGANTNEYYRYDTTQATPGSWENLTSTNKVPANVYYGGFSAYASNRNWVTSGPGTNSFGDAVYSYAIGSQANGTGFEKTGTYESEAMDLVSVYRWANLTVNYVQPNNTSLVFETRTSQNGTDWSSWTPTANDHAFGNTHVMSIVSAPATFIQIRATFTSSDRIFSPRLDDFTINYYQDIDPPTNPSAITARSSSIGDAITNNTWYNHTSPYFEWPVVGTGGGAQDNVGGSGIAGYYVYFGTNASADPFVDGSLQAGNSFVGAPAASGSNYYLKIKTIDNAGFVSVATYDAFTYRYDATVPNNPSDISVNPTGYSSAISYTFSWTPDASDDHSGVAMYQYRTGGDAAGVWHDIPDPATVTQAETHYQNNKNTFYLRTIDAAGNTSLPISQDYYYTGGPASPPQNLQVNPSDPDNETNSFTFTWEIPAVYGGDPTKLKYYYSINVTPTPYNTIETTALAAGPGPFATQYGRNTFYVVALNEGGESDMLNNADWNNPAAVNFYAKTSAPSQPLNAQAFDTSDRENAEYSVAVKWSAPTTYDSGNFAGYTIYRSEDNVDFEEIASTTGSAYVDTGLESKLYYYYVKAKDKTNNYSPASATVQLTPTGKYTRPPSIVKAPSVEVQSFAGTFTWATSRVASSFIEYGTTTELGETTGQVDSVTDHSVEVKGLKAETKYFYRAKYIDPDGNIGTSEILTFETLPPPTISDMVISDIGLNTATVSWKTNVSATCTLKYGKGGAYTGTVEETSGASSHVAKLEGMESAMDYKVMVDAVDGDGNSFSSDEYTFTTLKQPIVSDVQVQNAENVDIPTVTLFFKTDVPTTTLVKFKHSDEASFHNYLDGEKVTEHNAKIEGMDPAKEYQLVISGVSDAGVEAVPIEQKITTKTDSRPPEIVTNRAVGKVNGRGKDAQANIYVKIETSELTKVKIYFGKGVIVSNFEQSTPEDGSNTYHLITIPAEAGQVYSYQVEAKDDAGNPTLTQPQTIVTENKKQNATEVVVDTFASRFGWISKLWNK